LERLADAPRRHPLGQPDIDELRAARDSRRQRGRECELRASPRCDRDRESRSDQGFLPDADVGSTDGPVALGRGVAGERDAPSLTWLIGSFGRTGIEGA
jgi:hypothetical protein